MWWNPFLKLFGETLLVVYWVGVWSLLQPTDGYLVQAAICFAVGFLGLLTFYFAQECKLFTGVVAQGVI